MSLRVYQISKKEAPSYEEPGPFRFLGYCAFEFLFFKNGPSEIRGFQSQDENICCGESDLRSVLSCLGKARWQTV